MEQEKEFPESLKSKFIGEMGLDKGREAFALMWGFTEGRKSGQEDGQARLSSLRRENQLLRQKIVELEKLKGKNG